MVSSGMLNAVDPEGQKRSGRTDSAEHFFRDTYEGGGGLGDPDLIATMVRSSADVFAWLKSLGLNLIQRFMKPTPVSILARIERSKREAAWHTAAL